MAWTIVPNMDEDSDKPDIIQICPWFLDYAMKQDIQFQGQFKAGRTASMIVNLELDKLATWLKYTPIDLFQLFDKVMIHEVRTPTQLHVLQYTT
ncbi:hypothetical protein C2W62_03920 [Candidatus Entotheonella serta]|nr:hypothetical protein C2W62_03920 [Candidatus Entotheonella serta]